MLLRSEFTCCFRVWVASLAQSRTREAGADGIPRKTLACLVLVGNVILFPSSSGSHHLTTNDHNKPQNRIIRLDQLHGKDGYRKTARRNLTLYNNASLRSEGPCLEPVPLAFQRMASPHHYEICMEIWSLEDKISPRKMGEGSACLLQKTTMGRFSNLRTSMAALRQFAIFSEGVTKTRGFDVFTHAVGRLEEDCGRFESDNDFLMQRFDQNAWVERVIVGEGDVLKVVVVYFTSGLSALERRSIQTTPRRMTLTLEPVHVAPEPPQEISDYIVSHEATLRNLQRLVSAGNTEARHDPPETDSPPPPAKSFSSSPSNRPPNPSKLQDRNRKMIVPTPGQVSARQRRDLSISLQVISGAPLLINTPVPHNNPLEPASATQAAFTPVTTSSVPTTEFPASATPAPGHDLDSRTLRPQAGDYTYGDTVAQLLARADRDERRRVEAERKAAGLRAQVGELTSALVERDETISTLRREMEEAQRGAAVRISAVQAQLGGRDWSEHKLREELAEMSKANETLVVENRRLLEQLSELKRGSGSGDMEMDCMDLDREDEADVDVDMDDEDTMGQADQEEVL
ncbi:hypothetical protein BJ508DRAFT_333591 [Ascobolus immersus RN42]|uniref:Uncharacterized protein n=1 Tax=Ascobolus immersus RN42 TaxID=1160509 RepID=A0A3N4HIY4_ASCIM|nr:hypothetical protein BJ508DRAFT_333591 [Ascobolus immersus RN42]